MSNHRFAVPLVAIVLAGFCAAATANEQVLNSSTSLYIDKQSDIARVVPTLQGAEREVAEKIASFPIATWFTGGTPAEVRSRIATLASESAAAKQIPVIVAYNLPFRDCQQYSAGGAANAEAYKAWIDAVTEGIDRHPMVVLLEPDGLGIIPHFNNLNDDLEWCRPKEANAATAANERFELLNYAVDKFVALSNTSIYLDGTHSGWLPVGDVADRLVRAGALRTNGFFLNVSNYEPTNRLEKYGTWIAKCIHFASAKGASVNGASVNGASVNGASLNGASLNGASLNGASLNWERERRQRLKQCASQFSPAAAGDFETWKKSDAWYAQHVDRLLPKEDQLLHFVIDTSRNGRGQWEAPAGRFTDAQRWCNPPDRGLGERPTTRTGLWLVDAKLWIKVPGESDGQCTRGTTGPIDPARRVVDPPAGKWFAQQAAELVRFAAPAL